MKFEIKTRWSGKVAFAAEIEADDNTPLRVKIGLAVKWAVKTGADLSGANLTGANLSGAYLSGADLSGADLRPIRADFYDVLSAAPLEVRALREALIEGRVNGSTYEGKCACLIGTIANARHCNHLKIPDLEPDSSRPAERFFLGIKEGDTPENSQFAKIAVEWIDNWKPLHFIPEVTLQVT